MRKGWIGGALVFVLLAGCSRSREPQADAPTENAVEQAGPMEEAPLPVTREPAPRVVEAEPARNTVEALPPDETPSMDAQMLEDADATGMTARTATPDVVSDPSADPLAGATDGLDTNHR